MTTSTEIINGFVSSTGEIMTDAVPFFQLIFGTFLFMLAVGIILTTFKYGLGKAFKK